MKAFDHNNLHFNLYDTISGQEFWILTCFSHPVEGGQSSQNSSLVRLIKREGGRVCRGEEHAGFMLLPFRHIVVSQEIHTETKFESLQ